jgi:hypothetical protein
LRESLTVPDSRIEEIFKSRNRFSHNPPISPHTAKYYELAKPDAGKR